jgi:SAM-dependent methyltransferase
LLVAAVLAWRYLEIGDPKQTVMLKLYTELGSWWPLLSPPEDYLDEADFFHKVLVAAGLPPAPTLLELGCGGGNNAVHLKARFARATLTDLSPQMLAVSRSLNPDCEHLVGDMRTLRLGRDFDVVFIHDAIDYMTTEHDLRLALETAFLHCAPGGLALVVPDYVRETFRPDTEHGGSDGEDRALRYLEWTYDPDDTDTTYTVEYACVLREDDRPTRVEHDRHTCGLFPRAEWIRLLREAGFRPEITRDQYERDIFVARRPPQETMVG